MESVGAVDFFGTGKAMTAGLTGTALNSGLRGNVDSTVTEAAQPI